MSALLALFIRSLREDSRSKLSYWVRPLLACIVLVMLIMVQTTAWISSAAPGLKLFGFVLYVNVFFVTLAAVSYFASAITEEKEEMTLGLLRMTRLSGLSILLGKSTSRLCGALLMLVAQFPFTLLAVSLGGVSTGQVIAVYVALGAYLILVANVGLVASVIAKRTGSAGLLAGSMLFILFFGPPCIWMFRHLFKVLGFIQTDELTPTFQAFFNGWVEVSVFNRLGQILLTGFADSPCCFQVSSNLLLGVICFLLAWVLFEFFCGEQKESAPKRPVAGRRTWGLSFIAPGRVWRHAILWKDFFFIGGGVFAILLRVLAYFGLGILACELITRTMRGGMRYADLNELVFPFACVALIAEISLLMARVFRRERREKTWSTLMLLPMSTRRIAYHKIIGSLGVCLPTIALWCFSGSFILMEIFRDLAVIRANIIDGELFLAVSAVLTTVVMVICFLHLVTYLSLLLRWGGLALAVAIFGILSFFATLIGVMMFREASGFVLLFAWSMLTIVLHIKIGQRLVYLAAED